VSAFARSASAGRLRKCHGYGCRRHNDPVGALFGPENGRFTLLVAMRVLRWCTIGDGRLSWRAMGENRVLAAVSAAQLLSGLGGMALAIRRRHAFDVPFRRGEPSAVGRDCVLMGTALSAPVVMLAAQAGAIAALLRRPTASAERALGGLGAAMRSRRGQAAVV